MYAYHTWNVIAKFENDLEGDKPIQKAQVVKSKSGTINMADPTDWVAVLPQPSSFFLVNTAVEGDLSITFKKPPQPAALGLT